MEIDILGIKVLVDIPLRSMGMLIILWIFVIGSYILMAKMRKGRVIKFANVHTLKTVHGYKSIVPSPLLLLTKLVVVTLLFLVATESIQLSIMRPVANTDFCIAIDTSTTMLLPDYEPNRLEFVKETVLKWINELPGASKICVIKFSDKAVPLTPLTTNIFEIENKIRSIRAETNESGTAIGEAVFSASSVLSTTKKQRFLILITDGKNTVGRNVTQAIEEARSKNVIIYPIGIGVTNETREMISELQKIAERKKIKFSFPIVDERDLKKLAEETGGKFFFVTDENAFKEAMKDIVVKNERIPLNSDYYILIFISVLLALELLIFSKFGAI